MRLKIEHVGSPDLDSDKLPADPQDFAVYMEAWLHQRFHRGHVIFIFFVCSPGRDSPDKQPSMVMERFDWGEIQRRVSELAAECRECKTWDDVIAKLKGTLEYYD
jgi:hypothetical protein